MTYYNLKNVDQHFDDLDPKWGGYPESNPKKKSDDLKAIFAPQYFLNCSNGFWKPKANQTSPT